MAEQRKLQQRRGILSTTSNPLMMANVPMSMINHHQFNQNHNYNHSNQNHQLNHQESFNSNHSYQSYHNNNHY